MQLSQISLAVTRLGQVYDPRMDLFGAGEVGAWYDPSDLSTMFQDAAGTVPVTGVEQPVGMIRDKSGRGNHATQSTTTSRPVLSARYNLLTYSEQFDNAVWLKAALLAVTPNAATAPDGTTTADLVIPNTTSVQHSIRATGVAVTPLTRYTQTIWAKAAGETQFVFSFVHRASGAYLGQANATINLLTGGISTEGYGGTPPTSISATTENSGNGWWKVVLSCTTTATATSAEFYVYPRDTTYYTGDGTSGILIWGAQLIPTNALPSNAYQRVTTATDYDSNPALFPWYLRFDGTDDWLVTPSINFTSTDKMTVVEGVRQNGAGMLAELSANSEANNGTLYFYSGEVAAGDLTFGLRGTTVTKMIGGGGGYPNLRVFSAMMDIAGASRAAEIFPRINGAAASLTGYGSADAGAGNFGNYPLFIGRRGGTTLPFGGHLYGLIVRGAASSAAQIAAAERFMAQKTGVTL